MNGQPSMKVQDFLIIKLIFLSLLSTVFSNKAKAQIKKDTLKAPLFYIMVPKIIEFSSNYTPQSKLDFKDAEDGLNYKYNDELINSINLKLPVINKNDWRVILGFDMNNYNYRAEKDGLINYNNYTTHSYGLTVIRTFEKFGRKFASAYFISAKGNDPLNIKSLGFISSLTTIIELRNKDKIIFGLGLLFLKETKVPVIPILHYATWLSKERAWLLSIKLPLVDITATKVFNQGFFLKHGFNLLNNGHYISPSEYPFLFGDEDYQLNKLNVTVNQKIEKTFYKDFWVKTEIGYAFNIKSGVKENSDYIKLDSKVHANGFYVGLGVFYRPKNFKKK